MALKSDDIVRILQLKGMGRRTAKKFCELDFQGTGDDLIDFLIEVGCKNLLPRFPVFDKSEVKDAFKKGDDILEKSERSNIKIASFFDKKFPKALREINDPPLIINTKGNVEDVSKMIGVAVIGTRQPSQAGIKAGEYFGKQLALQNFNVVSGLAIGCDTAGHKGCLSANGFTTAILAHGLHTIYPKENFSLAEEILDKGGILLSEYFFGTGALGNYFVERDRLQAGLSQATIVIQTDEKGGTMHAVNATMSGGKKLAAIKYKGIELDYPKTKGNEKLIREGKAFALTSDNLSEFISSFRSVDNATDNSRYDIQSIDTKLESRADEFSILNKELETLVTKNPETTSTKVSLIELEPLPISNVEATVLSAPEVPAKKSTSNLKVKSTSKAKTPKSSGNRKASPEKAKIPNQTKMF